MFHLTDSRFLSNKNSDVQLLLACCIADLFRIFAPNSPFENLSLLKVRVKRTTSVQERNLKECLVHCEQMKELNSDMKLSRKVLNSSSIKIVFAYL